MSKKIKSIDQESVILTPRLSTLALAIKASILGLGLVSGASQAGTIEVNTNTDNGVGCTLREAIVTVNNANQTLEESSIMDSACTIIGELGANDSITFSNSLVSNTITLTNSGNEEQYSNTLYIEDSQPITIDASTISGGITLDGDDNSGIIYVGYSTLVINNITLTNGSRPFGGGVGLSIYGSNVSLNNSTISNSNGGSAIFSIESLVTLDSSTVSGNSYGGIYAASSDVTLNNSTISGNYAYGSGGAIAAASSNVTLNNSIVSGNTSNDNGGGISLGLTPYYTFPFLAEYDSVVALGTSNLTLNNSTISGNFAEGSGGAINAVGTNVTLNNSTVSENIASIGGGINASSGEEATDSSPEFGSDISALTSVANDCIDQTLTEDDFSEVVSSGEFNDFPSINPDCVINLIGDVPSDGEIPSVVSINNSTLSNNTGGGLYLAESSATLSNSTISSNNTQNPNFLEGPSFGPDVDLPIDITPDSFDIASIENLNISFNDNQQQYYC